MAPFDRLVTVSY